MPKLTVEDLKWRAQDDARAMIRTEEIEADKPRRTLAIKEVNRMKLQKEAELKALKSIANKN